MKYTLCEEEITLKLYKNMMFKFENITCTSLQL